MIDPDVQFLPGRVYIWSTANGITSARIFYLDSAGYPFIEVGKVTMLFNPKSGIYQPSVSIHWPVIIHRV